MRTVAEIGPGTNHFVVSPGPLRVCTVALGAYISALVLPLQQRSYSIASGYTLEVKTHEFPSEDQRSWTVQLPRS